MGRISKEMVGRHMPAPGPDVAVLVCGPPHFNALVAMYLTQLGFEEDMFHVFA